MIMQSAPSRSYTYAIDHPGALQAPEGFLQLSGWIAGESAVGAQVRLRLGQTSLFDCRTGEVRPDVAATYPDMPGAAQAGFRLEAHVPPGFHTGTLEYRVTGLSDWIPFHSLSLIAELSPLFAQLECEPPTEDTKEWHVRGWCFHPQCDIESVSVLFAHQQALLQHGDLRPDVAQLHPQFRTALDSGFTGQLRLEPGQAPVKLRVKLRNGSVLQQVLLPVLKVPDRDLERAVQVAGKIRATRIKLAAPIDPDVSIVIPIYNQLDFTLGCLESLVRHAGQTSFEVIIIDDRSDRHVAEALSSVSGLRLHSNEKNQGFVLNCNRGAAMARGKYVLFLNNDTEVQSDWLDSMIAVFHQRPKAGLVGAKLIYPDGRLQEAGNIISDDGSGWNYGRGDDADRPEYNYLRQTDYCSGACLLISRSLFLSLGGFDERYKPAYYEDTDLAFAVRAAGWEVYYQPAAQIVHFEGISSGTDITTGVKRHQTVNQGKFANKWAAVLKHYTADLSMVGMARDRHAPCRVLILDACALTPDADSGSLRMFNLLLMLARHGSKVTFAATNLQVYEPFSTQLRLEGVEYLCAPYICEIKQYLEANAFAFDVIVLSRKAVAQEFMDIARQAAPTARLVFDTVDLMYLRLERQAGLEQSNQLYVEAEKSKAIELSLCKKADLVFVVSPVEAELLGQNIPSEKIALVSNIHALHCGSRGATERNGIMFVGGFQHPPNVDAMVFFLDHVLPLIEHRLPALDVHVVGSNMPPVLHQRASSRVHMHGYIADLNPLYAQVRLTIAPLRYGAGVKGKVNQSMAHGVPVVATTLAVEGMHLVHERDVLVADTAADFANAIVRLHTDETLWRRIAAGGIQNIEEHFSFRAVEKELFRALGAELFLRKSTLQPLPLRPAAHYVLGEKILFNQGGNAQPYKRQGWAQADTAFSWIVGSKASLDFQLSPHSKPRQVKALIYPFLAPPALKRQRLLMIAPDGTSTTIVTLEGPASCAQVVWNLTESQMCRTHLNLTFLCPDAAPPAQFGTSSDVRRLSFAFLELTITE